MARIELTQGQTALVDDEDYEYVSQWKWHARRDGNTFYAVRRPYKGGKQQKIVYMHKIVAQRLGIKGIADHINGNGVDNRRSNLRQATNKQNIENQRLQRCNKSGHRGVCWFKRDSKWQASIKHNGRNIHLGRFDSIEDAVSARRKAEKKYFTHVTSRR